MTTSPSDSEGGRCWHLEHLELIERLYSLILGSDALAKACQDDGFDYALKLRTGEVIRFVGAKLVAPGWIHLDVMTPEEQPARNALPFMADRGIDVRIEDIVWVMDAPEGS